MWCDIIYIYRLHNHVTKEKDIEGSRKGNIIQYSNNMLAL